jgi:hypothetical protein
LHIRFFQNGFLRTKYLPVLYGRTYRYEFERTPNPRNHARRHHHRNKQNKQYKQ